MGQRFHPDIYGQLRACSQSTRRHKPYLGGEVFDRVLQRLRCVHVPVTLIMVRFRGTDATAAEMLIQPNLDQLGYLEVLSNGDTAILCIEEASKTPRWPHSAERRATVILTREIARLQTQGIDARCLVAFAHLWSDEFLDEPDVINLVHLPNTWPIEIN